MKIFLSHWDLKNGPWEPKASVLPMSYATPCLKNWKFAGNFFNVSPPALYFLIKDKKHKICQLLGNSSSYNSSIKKMQIFFSEFSFQKHRNRRGLIVYEGCEQGEGGSCIFWPAFDCWASQMLVEICLVYVFTCGTTYLLDMISNVTCNWWLKYRP